MLSPGLHTWPLGNSLNVCAYTVVEIAQLPSGPQAITATAYRLLLSTPMVIVAEVGGLPELPWIRGEQGASQLVVRLPLVSSWHS